IHLNLMIFTKIIRGFISTQGKNTQEQRMDLKTTWTTRKVRREKDPQNIQTKHQKRNQNASW
ncbi:hypothetical protein, partial [Escherichia coli]|uniref:hypothetical protein n=1 Tax=Escherichia coli TaxID=562 RepID=UPI0024114CD5